MVQIYKNISNYTIKIDRLENFTLLFFSVGLCEVKKINV